MGNQITCKFIMTKDMAGNTIKNLEMVSSRKGVVFAGVTNTNHLGKYSASSSSQSASNFSLAKC